MKQAIRIFIAFALILSLFTGAVSAIGDGQGTKQGKGDGTGIPLDDDGDGIPNRDDPDFEKTYQNQDNMNDDDGDGIPNGQDEDYVPLEDGTQVQDKNMNTLKNQVNSMKQENAGLGEEKGIANANAGIEGLKSMNQYSESTTSQKVSQIANSFEQKYQNALSAEEQINQRSGFSKFFFGGDEKLADSLNGLVNENRQLIQDLTKQLDEATEEEKAFIQEQIAALRSECDRLESVANEESRRKGIFDWW